MEWPGGSSLIPRKNVRGESVLQNVKIWSRATGSGDAVTPGWARIALISEPKTRAPSASV